MIKAMGVAKQDGLPGVLRRLKALHKAASIRPSTFSLGYDRNNYSKWLKTYRQVPKAELDRIAASMEAEPTVLFSILMPVYDPRLDHLEEAIQSVRAQLYPHWELCIADDCSKNAKVRQQLTRYSQEDPRIKYVFREQNGHISAASNSALSLATGSYLVLLDNDDILPPEALYLVAQTLAQNPGAKILYSDEDRIDDRGRRYSPYFKTDWNRELFYSQNMISHLGVYERELVQRVGGFRVGLEGSQDYDLALRCIEHIPDAAIVHIPHVLYHWRAHAASTALSASAKPYAATAAERALNEHFDRTGRPWIAHYAGIGYLRKASHRVAPSFALVLLDHTLANATTQHEGLLAHLPYPPQSIHLAPLDRVDMLAELNRFIAQQTAEVVLLLDARCSAPEPDMLIELFAAALQSDTGAAGGVVWDWRGRLQDGGYLLSHAPDRTCMTAGKHIDEESGGYFGRARLRSNYAAVTPKCCVFKTSLFQRLGGYDVSFQTHEAAHVDWCLKAYQAGMASVLLPEVSCREAAPGSGLDAGKAATEAECSAGPKLSPAEQEHGLFTSRWVALINQDPFYSPNLAGDLEDFSLAWPPRCPPISAASLPTPN